MPWKPKKPCAWPGCPELTDRRYCEKHSAMQPKREDKRPSSNKRGYDSRWEKVRLMYLREHPLCELCEKEGKLVPAVLVHHKKPIRQGGEVLDEANLMAVCRPCHDWLHRKG